MATKWQQVKIPLPTPIADPDTRAELGDLIVERIFERTDKGKDKDGRKFAGYSKDYIESLDFKNAGKSKGNINLQLSGDMLAGLKVLASTRNWIQVGFERGSEDNAKADGNIRGTYGQKSPIPGKARDFLGITDKELEKIVKYVTRK
jgi:hypothetical protein